MSYKGNVQWPNKIHLNDMNDLRPFFQQHLSRLLVVSTCTAKKRFRPPDQLTMVELDNHELRKHGELRLIRYCLPAAEMYTGDGHKFVRQALGELRGHGYHVSHFILSAGYGLLNESDQIVPYNVTFSGVSKAWIRERGQRLRLRNRLIEIASKHDRVILILGREYLEAIGLPLPVAELPPTLAYLATSLIQRVGNGIETISIGQAERRTMSAYSSSAKEKQFQLDVYNWLRTGVNHA